MVDLAEAVEVVTAVPVVAALGARRSLCSRCRIHNPSTRRQDHRRRTRRRRPRCNYQRRQCQAAVVDLADGGAAVVERGAAGDAGRSLCSRCRIHNPRTPHRGRRRHNSRRRPSCSSQRTQSRAAVVDLAEAAEAVTAVPVVVVAALVVAAVARLARCRSTC